MGVARLERALTITVEVRLSRPADAHHADPVEIRDSRIFFASWGILTGSLAALSVVSWGLGPFGLVVFGTHAVWSLTRLLSRRVRVRITQEGVVDENYWLSPGLITWDEILDVRPTKWGLIEIDLADEDAFLERRSTLAQLAIFKQQLYGLGPAVIVPWSLRGTRRELLDALETAMDTFALSKVRNGEALGPGVEDLQPTGGREKGALFR